MSNSAQLEGVKPNLFVLGAAKCGTTTLYHLLRQHPQIFMSTDKEPRFFDSDSYYALGMEKYLNDHFSGSEAYPVRGEATPSYLRNADLVAPRIMSMIGDNVRFMVIMRDPVKRAWSHYLHMLSYNAEDKSFEAALSAEPERLRNGKGSWISYYGDGLYAEQLQAWFKYYPRERFLMLLTDELRDDPRETARRMFEFLGLDYQVVVNAGMQENKASSARYRWLAALLNKPNRFTNSLKLLFPYVMRKQLRDWLNLWNRQAYAKSPELDVRVAADLRERYRDDILALERITGYDLSAWLGPGHPRTATVNGRR